jgi:ATP-dependent exoDNAse (exonuclease V) beta subunit
VVPRDRAPSTRSADLITAWENDAALEAKRVLYVGVTRAEQLCVLAIPEGLADRVLAILQGSGVSHDVIVV